MINLRWWLLGQGLLMVIIGITTTLSLWLLCIPGALTLGVLAGLLELVPFIGPWLSAIPAVLMALLISPWTAVLVALLFLALHILEGYVLLPLMQRRVVLLPPALTLLGQVLLGEVLGLLGLFVAAPLTVCAVVLMKMLYVEDTLGDQDVEVPGEPGSEQEPTANEDAGDGTGGAPVSPAGSAGIG
jgi:predicted PurR-regulated permease PerM